MDTNDTNLPNTPIGAHHETERQISNVSDGSVPDIVRDEPVTTTADFQTPVYPAVTEQDDVKIDAKSQPQNDTNNEDCQTVRRDGLIIKQLKNRAVMFNDEDQARLFDEVLAQYDKSDLQASFKQFCKRKGGDAIVKAVNGTGFYDFIIKYNISDGKDTSEKAVEKDEMKQQARLQYIKALLDKGMVLEEEYNVDKTAVYIKIITPFYLLCEEAERSKLSFELLNQSNGIQDSDVKKSHNSIVTQASNFVDMVLNVGVEQVRQPVAPFKVKKMHLFVGGDVKMVGEHNVQTDFFNTGQRIELTYQLLIDTKIAKYKKRRNVGIKRLTNAHVFSTFYPLHDGNFKKKTGSMNERAQLNIQWVSKMFAKQPLDKVKSYLGVKTALYFAWLGYYTNWVLAAAIVGLIVFFYGLGKISSASVNDQLLVRIFDNELSPVFSLFMAVWGTLFLEYWKRYQGTLAYKWDVWKFEKSELIRPEWRPIGARKSPITGKYELHQPTWMYRSKIVVSFLVSLVCIAIVILSVAAIIVYRVFINFAVSNSGEYLWVAPVTSGLFSLVVLIVLAMAYKKIAVVLNDWENHKFQTDYEDGLIYKQFLFDFVNTYASLFYIGLIQEHAGTNVMGRLGWNDRCSYSSCLADLTIQLGIIFVGKRVVAHGTEYFMPKIMKLLYQRQEAQKLKDAREKLVLAYGVDAAINDQDLGELDLNGVAPWVKEDMLSPPDDLNSEYNEMALQFGFMCLFITAFPLAPLFAYLNNLVEIRQDAYQLIVAKRRAVPFRAQDIGSWEKILTFISYFAVLTNAALIAFSSQNFQETYLAQLGPQDSYAQLVGKLAFVLIFEHLVFGLKGLFTVLIPDIPPAVKRAIEKEDYIARVTIDGEPAAVDDPEALELLGMKQQEIAEIRTTAQL
ncbi:hypothetical protein MIR68_008064 [Amoeboaphelidium protococcarum]|nr:hypothetical protein MIR68_008064 [Amoeboaphelidium protococcarum]